MCVLDTISLIGCIRLLFIFITNILFLHQHTETSIRPIRYQFLIIVYNFWQKTNSLSILLPKAYKKCLILRRFAKKNADYSAVRALLKCYSPFTNWKNLDNFHVIWSLFCRSTAVAPPFCEFHTNPVTVQCPARAELFIILNIGFPSR